MKKLTIKRVILLACIFCVMQNMQGECYVLNDSGEYSFSVAGSGGSKEFSFTGAGATLSFQAFKTMASAIGSMKVAEYENGSWNDIKTISAIDLEKNSYKDFSVAISSQATAIKFYGSLGSIPAISRILKLRAPSLLLHQQAN